MKFLVAITVLAFVSAANACPGIEVDDVCYFVEHAEGGAQKEEAISACESQEAELAIIPSIKAFDMIYFYALQTNPLEMILTGMEYDHKKSAKMLLTDEQEKINYKPMWFDKHPIKRVKHSEVVLIANRDQKYAGFMNIGDSSRYSYFLCSK